MPTTRFAVLLTVIPIAALAQPPAAPVTVIVTDVISGETFSLDLPPAERAVAAGLELSARQAVHDLPWSGLRVGPSVSGRVVELDLRDATGKDRAVDLDVVLPTDLTGWTWWHDINTSEPIAADSQFVEKQYPLIAVTSDSGGLAMAIEPSQPVIYEFRGTAQGLTLHTQLGLTPLGEGDLKSAAHVRVYFFPVDPAWGFRDALATYYRLFPKAFERFAMDEGMWLFAFPNERLPNPSHYAYHEGGPGGWRYDEEHGIGTYPYTEVSSRTVHMHRLPTDRQDALAAWKEYQENQKLTAADWAMRGGMIDLQVAHTGTRSLRCSKDDPAAWTGAVQDVMVDQKEAEPVTISGWLRAEDVTGQRDREISLYGDVLLQSGEWLFGQIASFEAGTHDWQHASYTIDIDQPIRMVRLHCLFRHGHTGTVWFDDISVTTASDPDTNLVLNPSFEEKGSNRDVAAIEAYYVEASDGHPVFFIRTDLSSDVKPETPMKLLRFCLDPSPYLRRKEGVELPPGPRTIENYLRMIESIPALDGAYIDSVSAWATRELDYRREHFYAVRHNFTYDPESKRIVAPGKYYTYDFLLELGRALHPLGKWVFTNIHNTMDTFLLYTVSDVPGIESSITDHRRFAYIRSASYHKPALLLNFLNLMGFDQRAKHDYHWRMAVLYGLYPSIGRRCDEAYELYGDLYRRFMPSLKRISAAGWEPVTNATLEPAGPSLERFGDSTRGLFFTAYNEADEDYAGRLVIDAHAFDLLPGLVACDTTTGWISPVEIAEERATVNLPLPAGEVAVVQIGTPTQIAAAAQKELDEIVVDLRRLEAEAPNDLATRVRELRGRIIGMNDLPPAPVTRQTINDLVALCNDETVNAHTWSGETAGQALLRALMLVERMQAAEHGPVMLEVTGQAVQGERGTVTLRSGGETATDAVFLMRDAEGLRVIGPDFAWPSRGYADGIVDLIGIGLGDHPGAVMRTMRFRPAVEIKLQTDDPWTPTHERVVTVGCRNNSSQARRLQLRIEAPAEDQEITPARQALDLPASGWSEAQFTVRVPAGEVRALPLHVVAEGGGDRFEADTVALCGVPAALESNLAQVDGVEISVDSCYQGYNPLPLNDGRIWPSGVHWTERAWASAESGEDHWIELRWPEAMDVSRVIIYWNIENERLHAARQVRIEALLDGVWTTVGEAQPQEGEAASIVELSPIRTTRLRIIQPAGQGPEHRPNLMWVTEVQVS